jgi:hypothetical protein
MFKVFGKSSTTKVDVIMALAGGLVAVLKAADTIKDYRAQQAAEEQEQDK